MSVILLHTASRSIGEEIGRVIEAGLPGADWHVASDWVGVLNKLFPIAPRALLIERGALRGDIPSQLRSVRRDLPWLPVVVLAKASALPGDLVLKLTQAKVEHFVSMTELAGTADVRAALHLDRDLPSRVAALLEDHWSPRPVPAIGVDALAFAVQRTIRRLTVLEMASALGTSKRTLRRTLKAAGAPPPTELIKWGRVLWAVRELEMNPRATGDAVAYDLGYSSAAALGNALASTLGGRIGCGRAMGLAGALEEFLKAFKHTPRELRPRS